MSDKKETLNLIEEINKDVVELRREFKESVTDSVKDTVEPLAKDLMDKLDKGILDADEKIEKIKTAMARQTVVDEVEEKEDRARHAFKSYLRSGIERMDPEERKEMVVGTDSAGGFAVEDGLVSEIYKIQIESSPMRQIANVQTISGTNEYKKNIQLDTLAGGWVAEAGTRSLTAEPTFGQVTITPSELYALAQISNQMLQDANYNVEGELISDTGRELARIEEAAFFNGTGSGQAKGITAYADGTTYLTIEQLLATATADTVSGDEIHALVGLVKVQHLANSRFVMNRQTETLVRQLKDQNDNYLWSPMTMATPSTLLGFPIDKAADMPVHATGGGDTLAIAFGDFRSAYTIVDRVGMSTLRDPYTVKGHTQFYTYKRVGGGLIDGTAIKFLVINDVL